VAAGPSLYRRHRPRTFADVVGQEHVVRTLRNAVQQGKVHHAYLFVGSRGTGKTSMAKMLAACLNCVNGPTTDPCGTCESCVSIANATSLDVIEMDAASNNSVDDIRELRDSVQFAPVSGRYKVYILDEAHMLSTAAWNAFLKTLEEPPPSTIFVLATTEAHKVMDTVVDRCHRFDFRRPTVEQLATVVQRVAEKESIAIGPEAVALVARAATGSYRDALGTLEQLVTYAGSAIATEDVLAVLGVADDELLFGAIDAVGARDARAAWRVAARLAESGRDAAQFLRDLEGHARDVLVVQTLGEVPSQLAMTADRDERLREQAARAGGADVVRLLDLLATGMRLARDGADAQTQLEIALVKAAAPEVDPSTRALLSRLERVERALAGGAVVSAASPSPPSGTVGSDPVRSDPTEPEQAPAPEPVAVATVEPVGALDLALVQELWPAVLQGVGEHNQMLATCLAAAHPVVASGRGVTLAFAPDKDFQRKKAESAPARAILTESFHALTGVTPVLQIETREPEQLGAAAEPEVLGEDALIARLRAEFDAVDHDAQRHENDHEEGPA